jgi:hypothetical protein
MGAANPLPSVPHRGVGSSRPHPPSSPRELSEATLFAWPLGEWDLSEVADSGRPPASSLSSSRSIGTCPGVIWGITQKAWRGAWSPCMPTSRDLAEYPTTSRNPKTPAGPPARVRVGRTIPRPLGGNHLVASKHRDHQTCLRRLGFRGATLVLPKRSPLASACDSCLPPDVRYGHPVTRSLSAIPRANRRRRVRPRRYRPARDTVNPA